MKKWTFIIDVAKCHDCNNCFLACKDESCGNDHLPYSLSQPKHGHRWMNIQRVERGQYPRVDVGYLPQPCMHCDEPACMQADTNNSISKRDDGIVIIDPVKAKGQKQLVDACPYHAIWWNEEEEVPQKCTFCAHLLDDGWQQPRCVQACPTEALSARLLDDSELAEMINTEQLEVYHPEHHTRPRVFYKNLFRYTSSFVAGGVALQDIDECAEKATVTLSGASMEQELEILTNNYGDFKFDSLSARGESFTLSVEYPGYEKQVRQFTFKESLNLGVLQLVPGYKELDSVHSSAEDTLNSY